MAIVTRVLSDGDRDLVSGDSSGSMGLEALPSASALIEKFESVSRVPD